MGKNIFNSVKISKPSSNVFDLSHDVKLSFNPGELVPIMCMEAVPGDKFNIGCESLLRFAPLVAPMMHRVDCTMHYFFVPNRILWEGWENFITNGGASPQPTTVPAAPFLTFANNQNWRLADYMGVPFDNPGVTATNTITASALPFAAYQCIYNEYYRDQNLQAQIGYQLADGDNTAIQSDLCSIRLRAWEHDYFTAALPFAQKGAAVDLPLGEITLDPTWDTPGITPNPTFRDNTGAPLAAGDVRVGSIGGQGDSIFSSAATTTPGAYDPAGTLEVEPTTINDLRRAFRLQEWLEKMARGGSRMIEVIKSMFGVTSSDKRLNRPEYITGTKSPVVISEVLNTTGDTGAADPLPQGNMAGHAISITSGKYGGYFCEEHGWIIGIMSVMPKPAYQQGLPRWFSKFDPTDYYWPPFANIGEQEVQDGEIFAYRDTGDTGTFGYVPRYSEYKYMPSRVAGQFKSSLDFWHWGRVFATPPALNDVFIKCIPDTRIFAVEDPLVEKMYCHVFNKVRAVRRMPKYGTPTF